MDGTKGLKFSEFSDLGHMRIGHIRSDGFEVKFPGFCLYAQKSPLNSFFYLIDITTKVWYKVVLSTSQGSPWAIFHKPRKIFGLILQESDVFAWW